MTIPSTEELQRLLNEAKSGPWEVRMRKDGYCEGVYTASGRGVCLDINAYDAPLAALAPALAAEVIRLREEMKSLRENYRELEKGYDEASIIDSPGRWFSHNVIQSLTRILEGEQA